MDAANGGTCVVGFVHGSSSSEASRRGSGVNKQMDLVFYLFLTGVREVAKLSDTSTTNRRSIFFPPKWPDLNELASWYVGLIFYREVYHFLLELLSCTLPLAYAHPCMTGLSFHTEHGEWLCPAAAATARRVEASFCLDRKNRGMWAKAKESKAPRKFWNLVWWWVLASFESFPDK